MYLGVVSADISETFGMMTVLGEPLESAKPVSPGAYLP